MIEDSKSGIYQPLNHRRNKFPTSETVQHCTIIHRDDPFYPRTYFPSPVAKARYPLNTLHPSFLQFTWGSLGVKMQLLSRAQNGLQVCLLSVAGKAGKCICGFAVREKSNLKRVSKGSQHLAGCVVERGPDLWPRLGGGAAVWKVSEASQSASDNAISEFNYLQSSYPTGNVLKRESRVAHNLKEVLLSTCETFWTVFACFLVWSQ